MKKIITVILVLSMCLVGGYVGSFNNKEKVKEEISYIEKEYEISEEEVEENGDNFIELEELESETEEVEVVEKKEDVSDNVVVSNPTTNENTTTSTNVSSNTTSSNTTSSNTTSSNNSGSSSNSNNSVVTEVEKNESSNNNNNNTVQKEEVETKEPVIETVDTGYQEAMKEVEYATYNECFNAGMEASMKDTVNVLGFDVKELYYGGKIIGYKLVLRYDNPLN